MDMEARSHSPEHARPLLQKCKEYKADLSKLREDARRAAAAGGAGGGAESRAELGLAGDFYQTSAGQRDRLLNSTDRLTKTGDRIQQGRQQLLETEVGAAWGWDGGKRSALCVFEYDQRYLRLPRRPGMQRPRRKAASGTAPLFAPLAS